MKQMEYEGDFSGKQEQILIRKLFGLFQEKRRRFHQLCRDDGCRHVTRKEENMLDYEGDFEDRIGKVL